MPEHDDTGQEQTQEDAKGLRKQLEDAIAERDRWRGMVQQRVLTDAGVSEKAHGLVTNVIPDDFDWTATDAAEKAKGLAADHGFAVQTASDNGDQPDEGGRQDAETQQRQQSQRRLSSLQSESNAVTGVPRPDEQIAEAEAQGDFTKAGQLKAAQIAKGLRLQGG